MLLSARKRTRTSTGLPQLGPEPSASTNSAIRAGATLVMLRERDARRRHALHSQVATPCPQQDSNLYAISGTGTSSQPVCQFQHVGVLRLTGRRNVSTTNGPSSSSVTPGGGTPFTASATNSFERDAAHGAEGSRTDSARKVRLSSATFMELRGVEPTAHARCDCPQRHLWS
jgi:hypothetical protein